MSPLFRLRLALDLVAFCLLLVAYAYWWQGNVVHEFVGTGMFGLLILHAAFNRRWFRMIPRAGRRLAGLANISLTLLLLVGMMVLLLTSLMISQSVPDVLPISGGPTARELHILAAWWVLVLVAVHLGLRWPIVMAATGRLLGITGTHWLRTLILRVAAITLGAQGLASAMELGLGVKLAGEITMDMWDFNESAISYFAHLVAIVALCSVLTHYTSLLLRSAIGLGSSIQ